MLRVQSGASDRLTYRTPRALQLQYGGDMDANPRKLHEFLYSGYQYVIPVFQRKYVWKRANWERLWEDLASLPKKDSHVHFMGSVVSAPYKSEAGTIPQLLVIDGQQRMITLVALLAAIRDEAQAVDAGKLSQEIQTNYLVHQYAEGDLRYRVFPRLLDRQAFFDLVDEVPNGADGSGITDAYRYFRAEISRATVDGDTPAYLASLFTTVTQQLAFVSITLDSEQNPWAIFETLNARGVPLKQSDLIRNQVFMRVPLSHQDDFDKKYWRPFEDLFEATSDEKAIDAADFYRDFLMRDGTYVRPENTSLAFQGDELVNSLDPEELACQLRSWATCYVWIHRPKSVPDGRLAIELDLLVRLKITATYPLVLHLLKQHADGLLAAADVAKCIRALQSFYIRRSVAGWASGAYNKILPAAIPNLEADDIVGSLTCYLAKRGWPSDEEFLERLVTYPLYRYGLRITQVALLELENPTAHKETVDVGGLIDSGKISIEHVLPQTIKSDAYGQEWRAMLGADWEADHAKWLHTIGNLTLTGYNTPLSNRPYPWKREKLADSHLRLNEWFTQKAEWNAQEIRQRGGALSARVAELWGSAGAFDASASGIVAEDTEDAPSLQGPELTALYKDFWQGFEEHLKSRGSHEVDTAGGYLWYRRIRTGLAWVSLFVITRANEHELAVQVHSDSQGSPTLFNYLRSPKVDLSRQFGGTVEWKTHDGATRRTLEVIEFLDLSKKSEWPAYYEWLDATLTSVRDALMPLVGLRTSVGEARKWDETSFFEALKASCPAAETVVRRVLEWALNGSLGVRWGGWGKSALLVISAPADAGGASLLRIYGDNAIAITFNALLKTGAFASDEARGELLERINGVNPIELPASTAGGEPWIPLTALCDAETRVGFLEAIGWAVERLQAVPVDS